MRAPFPRIRRRKRHFGRPTWPAWPLLCALSVLIGSAGCDAEAPDRPIASIEHPTASDPREATASSLQAGDPDAEGPPWFEEVAKASGIDFVHDSGARGDMLYPEIMSGGVALFDMDGDADLDLYFVQSGAVIADSGQRPGNQLYRNLGGGRFENASAGSGADDRGYGSGVATGDFDNDGDVDLYVTNLGANRLLRNEGEGQFEDVTADAGVGGEEFSSSAAFLDYDRDGWLDLFVANNLRWSLQVERDCANANGIPDYCGPTAYDAPLPDRLYRNLGDGRFEDVSRAAGLQVEYGNGLGVVPADFDDDGWPDIFVANDGLPDQLWRNRGDGSFEDVGLRWGVAVDRSGQAKAGMGTDAADLDEDGDLDLLVVNLYQETDSLFLNQGGYFEDASARFGLTGVSRSFTRFGTGFADFDLNGRLDLYQANGRVRWQRDQLADDPFAEPNLLWRGQADGSFREQRPRGGTRPLLVHTSRGAAFGDLDDDGRMDIVVVNRDAAPYLLRNIAEPSGHWLRLRALTEQGRDALGARVTMELEDRRLIREVRSAYGYLAANDPRIHLGLSEAQRVLGIVVRWPDGRTERFAPPAGVDRDWVLRQGEGSEP